MSKGRSSESKKVETDGLELEPPAGPPFGIEFLPAPLAVMTSSFSG